MFAKDLSAELRSRDLPPIVVGLTLAIVVSGPFGSYAMLNFWQRLLFWFPVLCIGIFGFLVVRVLILRQFSPRRRSLGAVVAAALYAIVAAPFFGLLFRAAFGPYFGTLAGWGEIGTLVYLVSLGLCFLRHPGAPGWLAADIDLSVVAPQEIPVNAAAPSEQPVARLLDRLDPCLRGEIRSLQVRDHYVEISTDKGRAAVLMRLSDAIAELPPGAGAQVHRSFWVAWSAVNGVETEGARVFLRLDSGLQVPVSRANLAKLEQRGLI